MRREIYRNLIMANEVRITIGADTKSADRAVKSFREKLDGMAGKAKAVGAGLSVMGAGGIVAIKSLTGAAMEQVRAERLLEAVITTAGESYEGQVEKINKVTAALQAKTNFGDEAQLAVLSKLVPTLGSTELALKALPAVMDVASTTGEDLNAVAKRHGPILAGATNNVASLGLKFEESQGPAERIATLIGRVGGAAEANADPMQQMKNDLGDVFQAIGMELLPLLIPLIDKVRELALKAQNVNPVFIKIGAVMLAVATAIGVIGGPILLLIGFLPALAAGFALVSAAALPITLIVLGITAAIAAGILIWKNWDKIILFVKEQLNNFIGVLNDKVIPILNNLIKAFNFITRSSVDTIEPLKKLDTTADRTAAVLKTLGEETSETKTQMKDLSDFAHITNDELGEMVETTDKAKVAFGGLSGSLTAFGKAPDVRTGKAKPMTFGMGGGGMGTGMFGYIADAMGGMFSGHDTASMTAVHNRIAEENRRLRGQTSSGAAGITIEVATLTVGDTDSLGNVAAGSIQDKINRGFEFA